MTDLQRQWFGWHITRSGMKAAELSDAALVGLWRKAKTDARLRPHPPPRVIRTAHIVTPAVQNRVVALETALGRQAVRALGTMASTVAAVAALKIGGPVMGALIARMFGSRWTAFVGVFFVALGSLSQQGFFPEAWTPVVNQILTIAVGLGLIAAKDAAVGSGPEAKS